ncbi:MAG: DMT family transporter [Termitinemataceae bacterium]
MFTIFTNYAGEMAALGTSLCWTVTALAFEYAAKRIGSLALNILRLFVALFIFMIINLVRSGQAIPLDAGGYVWFWLSLSGLVGFVFGDIFLFQSYIDIGARTAQVIFVSSPLITAILGYFLLGERIKPIGVLGMLLVIGAIVWVILEKRSAQAKESNMNKDGISGSKASGSNCDRTLSMMDQGQSGRQAGAATRRLRGVLFAFFGALGQSGGLILSKIGAPQYDPLRATEIRVIAGLIGFLVMAMILRKLKEPVRALRNLEALKVLSLGAFFGPFLGVSLGLFAVQRANTGVAATLMGLTPILIVFPSVIIYKEKLTVQEVLGAVLAVLGLTFLFLA